jgi:putative CocE/NonD family hydrolase
VPEGEELTRGAHGGRARVRREVAPDAYDLVEWVARQPWCSGKIAYMGYSAGGMATLPVLTLNPPSLTAIVTHIASADARSLIRTRGGVGNGRHRGPEGEGGWAPAALPPPDRPTLLQKVRAEDDVRIYKTDLAGWYDLFLQGSIDDWVAWQETGRAVLVIGAGTHGAHPRPSRLPPDYCDADLFWPDVPQMNLLNGGVDETSIHSVIYYFCMGDMIDPEAPGNRWKVTERWPLPHTATSFYLTGDHGLQETTPEEAGAAVTYAYDPNDPVERVDAAWRSAIADGPVDQRPLRERDDVIYFSTDPLDEPVEVTGRIWAELHVSTDVPDTTFMVKLLDIYPDGYEAMIAQGAVMARYHKGLEQPEPLEAGTVYKLSVDLWSTAIVFAPGHRIGVYVTSSEAGRYAVHPNSYEPVESYAGAPVAHNSIHVSTEHPSRLILPVIAPGVSTDYDPDKHQLCVKLGEWEK